jgi:hypothetical protein
MEEAATEEKAAEEVADTPKPGNQQRVHFQTPEANVIAKGSTPSDPLLTINSQSAGEAQYWAGYDPGLLERPCTTGQTPRGPIFKMVAHSKKAPP